MNANKFKNEIGGGANRPKAYGTTAKAKGIGNNTLMNPLTSTEELKEAADKNLGSETKKVPSTIRGMPTPSRKSKNEINKTVE